MYDLWIDLIMSGLNFKIHADFVIVDNKSILP